MSYESEMLEKYSMPSQEDVEKALLIKMYETGGSIKEFSSTEDIVKELADEFSLSSTQMNAFLETIYKKENRVKRSNLWHRLLYRSASQLSKSSLISKPSDTEVLTGEKEWMLTEKGFNLALEILNLPLDLKEYLQIKSFEVQKVIANILAPKNIEDYNPINEKKKKRTAKKIQSIRDRGFRQAVISSYGNKCSVCGLKLNSPDKKIWEVEAAHIIPHSYNGKDEILNGISLCRLHHWAFDVGWFSITDEYGVIISNEYNYSSSEIGKMFDVDVINSLKEKNRILLPHKVEFFPHKKAISWHRNNIFRK